MSEHPNKDLGKALGRILVVSMLYKAKIISASDRVHLLGCAVPQEFGWYKDMPFIESIDTSNPVMAALENITYTGQGLNTKPKANMNDYFNINYEDVNYQNVLYNTAMFRKINGLNHK